MSKYKNRFLLVLCCTLLMMSLSACGEAVESVEKCGRNAQFYTYYGDFVFSGKAVADYEKIVTYVDVFGMHLSMGPTDPQYRGIIYISEEDAQRLLNDYEWEPVEDAKPDCAQVDMTNVSECNWMSSHDFTYELFEIVIVNACYFNGVDAIYFDIQTT